MIPAMLLFLQSNANIQEVESVAASGAAGAARELAILPHGGEPVVFGLWVFAITTLAAAALFHHMTRRAYRPRRYRRVLGRTGWGRIWGSIQDIISQYAP